MQRHATAANLMLGAAVATGLLATACSDYREGHGGDRATTRIDMAREAVANFKAKDPSLARFFNNAAGYAVFPDVTKGAAGIGAANDDGGVVYESGGVVGFSELTQVTVGLQLGGQSYQELIFFQDKTALDNFKGGHLEFDANASAVATTAGAASSADFDKGVAVFTLPRGGLMFEASIGGQKFTYAPRGSEYAEAR